MEERQNKSNSSKESLYQTYREYVQFLNDIEIVYPLSFLMMMMPNLVIISDLLAEVGSSDIFVQKVSYLGISEILLEITKSNDNSLYVPVVLMGLVFLVLIVTILSIVITNKIYPNANVLFYKLYYQKSSFHQAIRCIIMLFQYTILPVLVSYGIKLTSSASTLLNLSGIILVILPILFYFIFEYHSFQLIDDNQGTDILLLVRINFPYNYFDNILIIINLILINKTNNLTSFAISLAITALRIFFARCFPYYPKTVQKEQIFILFFNFIISLGFLFASFTGQYYIVIIIIVCVGIFFSKAKKNLPFIAKSTYEKVKKEEKEEEEQETQKIELLKKQLLGNGHFTHIYRRLIIESRKNNTHRNSLLIQILKSKCFGMEALSRGGVKMINSEDLTNFEGLILNFVSNLLLIAEHSVSLLKFIQSKQCKIQIFGKEVQKLANLINQNKSLIEKMFEINQFSHQAKFLLISFFHNFYNDNSFIKEIQAKLMSHLATTAQKQLKHRLFSEQTCVIFLNILDEVGKIVKISKNLPSVLGYAPHNLMGLSINEIIPFSIKPYHEENLMDFIKKYSKKTMRSDPKIQFYAYNSRFHLQEVCLRYNWIMSYFNSFQLCGVMEKVFNRPQNIILTDYYGNIEGWSESVGSQFNLDQLSMNQCRSYNIMPLFPTLLKYMDMESICIKTIFFTPMTIKDKHLKFQQIQKDSKGEDNQNLIRKKQLQIFQSLLQFEELPEAYLADIQFVSIKFCSGKVKLRKIVLHTFQRIQNTRQLQNKILRQNFGVMTERSIKEIQSKQALSEISDQHQLESSTFFSVDSEPNSDTIDSQFSLEMTSENIIFIDEIILGNNGVSRTSLEFQKEISKISTKNTFQSKNHTYQNKDKKIIITQNSFNPKLHKHFNFLPLIVVLIVGFLILKIFDMIALINANALMQTECDNVLKRNKALMVYSKTVFNPNQTYARYFDLNNLVDPSPYLSFQNLNYTTFLGDTLNLNKYYIFNTQIPSAVLRLALSITIADRNMYYKQIESNFNRMIQQYDNKFRITEQNWNSSVQQLRSAFYLRFIFICIGSVILLLILIYLSYKYQNQSKLQESFFKFEKEDLEKKIETIKQEVLNIEKQMYQWHFLKQFGQFIKSNSLSNVEFRLVKNSYQPKINFEITDEKEEKIQKNKTYAIVIVILIFIAFQIIFLTIHMITNLQQLNYYTQIPTDLNQCSKLIVLPNLQLADLFISVPPNIIQSYQSTVTQVLSTPFDTVPNLYQKLFEAPCQNCTFMFPVLTTNFRSFYSTFQYDIAAIKKLQQKDNITDHYLAVDVVTTEILNALQIVHTSFYSFLTIIIYFVSLLAFYLAIYFGASRMKSESQKLQLFLKYFNQEILTKNKHMNRLFSKNS